MKLTYTKTKPTVSGWYWTRFSGKSIAQYWDTESLRECVGDIQWAGPIHEDQLPQKPDQFDTWWKSLEPSVYHPGCNTIPELSISVSEMKARALWNKLTKLIKEGE